MSGFDCSLKAHTASRRLFEHQPLTHFAWLQAEQGRMLFLLLLQLI